MSDTEKTFRGYEQDDALESVSGGVIEGGRTPPIFVPLPTFPSDI
jgi:hypothetical protein